MGWLLLGLVIFLGVHSVSIAAEPWRDRMANRLGEWPWKGIYSVVAIIGLALVICGYGLARQDPTWLYMPPPWMRHVSFLLLLPVFPLLLAAYFPGRIQATLKHPMLVAVKLWALAHLLTNGTAADVLLFGSILAWAVADRISLKRRTPRPIPALPRSGWNDVVAVAGGLAIYVAFVLWLHRILIGMPLVGGA